MRGVYPWMTREVQDGSSQQGLACLRRKNVETMEFRWSAGMGSGEYSRRIAVRNARDWREERDARVRGLKFEVFRTSNPELRTLDPPFSHVAHF